MTTLVIPWRGDKPQMLEASLMTALESFLPDDVMIIGGYEEKAHRAFEEASSWAAWLAEWHWKANPYTGLHDPLLQTNEAMRIACQTSYVSDPFVWAADDLFWPSSMQGNTTLEDLAEMNTWTLGAASQSIKLGQGIHGTALLRTIKDLVALDWLPDQVYDFEGHWPLVVRKDRMLRALDISTAGQKRTVYGNLLLREQKLAPQIVEDVKVFKSEDLPPGRDRFVSTGSAITEKEVNRWLSK